MDPFRGAGFEPAGTAFVKNTSQQTKVIGTVDRILRELKFLEMKEARDRQRMPSLL
jgi:hypothetical protein